MSSRQGVRELLADERRELVEFLRTLSNSDWEHPSLCEGWRVRDVTAHLLYDTDPLYRYLWDAVASGFSQRRAARRTVARADRMTSIELVTALERSVDRGAIAAVAPSVALADVLIHHQDIRRPLNRPREIDPARLIHVLDHPDPFAYPHRRTGGLRFIATDVPWSHGDGPEVHGPAEAIALAVAGRAAALDGLSGAGVEVLRNRLAPTVRA